MTTVPESLSWIVVGGFTYSFAEIFPHAAAGWGSAQDLAPCLLQPAETGSAAASRAADGGSSSWFTQFSGPS